ncbi:hypothetical protein VPH35_002583 [Triticum aestivum]
MRSTDTYLPKLSCYDLPHVHGLQQPLLSVHPSSSLQHRSRREQPFPDETQINHQAAHVRPQPQILQSAPHSGSSWCCSSDSHRVFGAPGRQQPGACVSVVGSDFRAA